MESPHNPNELGAQERAALVAVSLSQRQALTWDEIRALSGLTYSGAYYMMTKIARVLPVYYDYESGEWRIID